MESDSTSQITRPPDGPWKWPESWHVLRECPEAMDLINGQLRHWTNCAGVIADAFEEGGYPKLARSVRGMQGGYRSEPIERWEIGQAAIRGGENSIALIGKRHFDVYLRDHKTSDWRSGVISVPQKQLGKGVFYDEKRFLTWADQKLCMWWFDESGKCVGLECKPARGVIDVVILPDRRIFLDVGGGQHQLWLFIKNEWVFEWSGSQSEFTRVLDVLPIGHLVSVDYDNRFSIWENESGRGWEVKQIDFSESPSGVYYDIFEWPIFKGQIDYHLSSYDTERSEGTVFLPDGRWVSRGEKGMRIWSKSRTENWSFLLVDNKGVSDTRLDMLPDGSIVCSNGEHFEIWRCSEETKWHSMTFSGHTSAASLPILLSDGSLQSHSFNEVLRWGNEQHRPSTPLPQMNLRGSWWSRLLRRN